jgi:Uncharacterized conserved protein (DUF2190)
MADYLPVYASGSQPLTRTASAAVTGGRLVETTTAGACGPAAAGSVKVIGVAAQDVASGAVVAVWPLANLIHEVESSAAIAVGDGVQAAANGQINTGVVATLAAAGSLLGIAQSAAGGASVKTQFLGR